MSRNNYTGGIKPLTEMYRRLDGFHQASYKVLMSGKDILPSPTRLGYQPLIDDCDLFLNSILDGRMTRQELIDNGFDPDLADFIGEVSE